MSKTQILEQLPHLRPEDRLEIFDRLCELTDRDLVAGTGATTEEKTLLDRELEDFQRTGDVGSPWESVEARLRGSSAK